MKSMGAALVAVIILVLLCLAGTGYLLLKEPEVLVGPMGPAGPQGIQGVQGMLGQPGLVGPAGPSGGKGSAGPAGATGPMGPSGADGVDAPVNNPPVLDCGMNGSFFDEGYFEYYTFNLSVNLSDSDDTVVQSWVYYRLCEEDSWKELWMTTDHVFNVSKVLKYAYGPDMVSLWWLVIGWDGCDLTEWQGNWTVSIPMEV